MSATLAEKVKTLCERDQRLRRRVDAAKGNLGAQFNVVRDAYRKLTPEIVADSERGRVTHPYFLNWKFTVIEKNVWNDIRPCVPLYPQYPVLQYFIDFANPYWRVGVEADGKAYHQDVERDRRRDRELYNQGWTIYRIPGAKTFPNHVHPRDEDRCEDDALDADEYRSRVHQWYLNNSEGIVSAIAQEHFSEIYPFSVDRENIDAVIQTLEEHVSIGPGCVRLRGRMTRHENYVRERRYDP